MELGGVRMEGSSKPLPGFCPASRRPGESAWKGGGQLKSRGVPTIKAGGGGDGPVVWYAGTRVLGLGLGLWDYWTVGLHNGGPLGLWDSGTLGLWGLSQGR